MENTKKDKTIILWRDTRFLIGISLIILSFFVGEFGKGLSIIKYYIPKYLITGLSLWAFSWILLLIGVFLVGMETLKMIKARINHHVRKTYHYTKGLPKKGYHYTKKLISKNG